MLRAPRYYLRGFKAGTGTTLPTTLACYWYMA